MARASDPSIEEISRQLLAGATGLAKRARRVLRWQCALWWLAVVVATLGLLMVGDMLLRREELGLRILCWLAWVAVGLWGAWRWLRPAWSFSPKPVEIATWIERGEPKLGGELSTAVELASLPMDEARYGSLGFRELALRQWSTHGQGPDWQSHLELSGLRRAAIVCASLLLALGLLSLLWPGETRVAMARLVMPWSVNHWPQRDQLAFRSLPTVVAVGNELQLEIIDSRPPLPERVELQTRSLSEGGVSNQSSLETIQVDGVAVANLPSVTSAIQVRAVGGDDRSMPWHRIDVVQPPELIEYQFVVRPPPYTGLPPSEVVGRRIAVLAGSQVEFVGRFNEPLKRVDVQLDSPIQSEQNHSESAQWSARLGDEGRELRIELSTVNSNTVNSNAAETPLTVQHSVSWQLSIITTEGLTMLLPERWRIEVNSDAPPLVAFQSAELAELSADARLAVRGMASDDLGLTSVFARLQVDGVETTQPASLPIWTDATNADTQLGKASERREIVIDTQWNIAQAHDLQAGQHISVWLEACDTSGQWGRSAVQEFTIRDPRDLVDSIQQKQNQLLNKVRELVDTQRRNAQLFNRATQLTQQAGRVQREQLDLFRNVAQVQRAIHQQFQANANSDSLTSDVAKLSELLTQNRLGETELAQQLAALQSKLNELSNGALRVATQASELSLQAAQSLHVNQSVLPASFSDVNTQTVTAQSEALTGLEGLLDRMARDEAVQQVQRELAQILNQQNAIRTETDQLQLERLSANRDSELRAKQTGLSADQQGLARRLDDLVRRAGELQAGASDDQQALKSQLERAAQSLTSSQASSKMRRATDEIRDDKLAQAAATQQEVAQLLNQTLQQLGAGNSSPLGGLQNRADALRQTGEELAQLSGEQAKLAEEWNEANAPSARQPLLREQNDLQQRTSTQANQAAQVGDANLSSQIEQAVSEQQSASRSGQQQNFQQAAQAAKRAAEQLQQSAEQLRQRAEQLEQQVAEQQLLELTAEVSKLASRQRPVVEEFSELALPAPRDQRVERQAQMRQAASQQEVVRQALRDVRGKTSKLPTFDWTLEQAELSMSRAVAAAQRYRVQPDAIEAAGDALRLLELATAAMQNEPTTKDSASQDDANADNSSESDDRHGEATQPRPIPMIASLKLLRSLQQEINSRTIDTENATDSGGRSQRLNELSSMQQALSTQVEQLLREFAAANDTGEN